MPKIELPFDIQGVQQEKGYFESLPPALKEACLKNPHLKYYVHLLPVKEIGLPEYKAKISRSDNDKPKKNLIYPVSDDIYIHILSAIDGDRDNYIPIEPGMSQKMGKILDDVEEKLLDISSELLEAETEEEKKKSILGCLAKVCSVTANAANLSPNGKVYVTAEQMEALKYLVIRDKLGMGVLEPLIHDSNIEDISCSGVGQIFLEHKVFKSVRSAITFESHDDLDDFVLRLSEQIKIPVTLRKPIVDATLPDGSRINIVFGREISRRGSNFTIRKFADTPLSILELVEFGSISYENGCLFILNDRRRHEYLCGRRDGFGQNHLA